MQWDDRANVCQAASTPTAVMFEVSPNSIQPLTRKECDLVLMAWNDNANVCGGSAGSATQATAKPVSSTLVINIDKTRQRMTVSVDGAERYKWPVSTGRPGYSTPSGTFIASSMNEIWYSKQWDNAPMPHAVFFTKEGHAIHGTNEVKRLGKPASHGCVRISPQNAATHYQLVERNGLENTHVVLIGLTPGGEGKVALSTHSKSRRSMPQGLSSPAIPADEFAAQPTRRDGLFRRLFGRR
jgi:L,D-transpeptidase catalytic domain